MPLADRDLHAVITLIQQVQRIADALAPDPHLTEAGNAAPGHPVYPLHEALTNGRARTAAEATHLVANYCRTVQASAAPTIEADNVQLRERLEDLREEKARADRAVDATLNRLRGDLRTAQETVAAVRAARDHIAAALTAEHYRRAESSIVASPEEHSAAMADVVMSTLALTTVADGQLTALDRVRALRDAWRDYTMAPQTGRLLDELSAALADPPPAPDAAAHTGPDTTQEA